jgi:hypothetical protein
MESAFDVQARTRIENERLRQIAVEGWSPEHDDQHEDGELLRAAVFYYQYAARPDLPLAMRDDGAPVGWPWHARWWKPKGTIRSLEIAGALARAEEDRRERHGYDTSAAKQKIEQITKALANALAAGAEATA